MRSGVGRASTGSGPPGRRGRSQRSGGRRRRRAGPPRGPGSRRSRRRARSWRSAGPVPPPAKMVTGGPAVRSADPVPGGSVRALIPAASAAGVVCGIAGLFPGYFSGSSLAAEPTELVPHVAYLAVWSVSAVLIWLGGARLRVGALLGAGLSLVTFGFFLADVGTAIAGGGACRRRSRSQPGGGRLACAACFALALRIGSAGLPGTPHGHEIGAAATLSVAALGAAVAFAPSWDSYTLRTSACATQSLTAGNAFANPALVIAGNVAVMVALVAVVVAAALWRPVRLRTALLAGAIIPMAAQVVSALVLVGEPTSPTQFGISTAQAAQAGLTISSGVTRRSGSTVSSSSPWWCCGPGCSSCPGRTCRPASRPAAMRTRAPRPTCAAARYPWRRRTIYPGSHRRVPARSSHRAGARSAPPIAKLSLIRLAL